MPAPRWSIVIAAVLGGMPIQAAPPVSVMSASVPQPAACCTPRSCEACGCGEPRYPFDAQDAWTHGYFQEVAPYAGFNAFRPYNYKHVFVQSQIVTEWGLPASAAYTQQFWQRYQSQAATVEEAPQLQSSRAKRPSRRAVVAVDRETPPRPAANRAAANPNQEIVIRPAQRILPVASFVQADSGRQTDASRPADVAHSAEPTVRNALYSEMVKQWSQNPARAEANIVSTAAEPQASGTSIVHANLAAASAAPSPSAP